MWDSRPLHQKPGWCVTLENTNLLQASAGYIVPQNREMTYAAFRSHGPLCGGHTEAERRMRRGTGAASAIFVCLSYLRVASGLIRSTTTLSSVAMDKPAVLPAKAPLPRLDDGITVVSFNVLLPNGNDGWWMYKVHLETVTSLLLLLSASTLLFAISGRRPLQDRVAVELDRSIIQHPTPSKRSACWRVWCLCRN